MKKNKNKQTKKDKLFRLLFLLCVILPNFYYFSFMNKFLSSWAPTSVTKSVLTNSPKTFVASLQSKFKKFFPKNNHLHFMTKSHLEPAIIQDSLVSWSSCSLLGLWLHLCLAYCLRSATRWMCIFKEINNGSIFICGFALHSHILSDYTVLMFIALSLTILETPLFLTCHGIGSSAHTRTIPRCYSGSAINKVAYCSKATLPFISR